MHVRFVVYNNTYVSWFHSQGRGYGLATPFAWLSRAVLLAILAQLVWYVFVESCLGRGCWVHVLKRVARFWPHVLRWAVHMVRCFYFCVWYVWFAKLCQRWTTRLIRCINTQICSLRCTYASLFSDFLLSLHVWLPAILLLSFSTASHLPPCLNTLTYIIPHTHPN